MGALGFGVDKADTRAENLSGGEKARLLLALATFHGPHLLILDEPTNHLDVDSREALVRTLNDYEGAVILISHDRHLMDACTDRLWIVRDGTVKTYDGDIDRYRAECLAERRALDGPRSKSRGELSVRPSAQTARRQAAEQRAALAPLKGEVAKAEAQIEALSRQIATDRRCLGRSGHLPEGFGPRPGAGPRARQTDRGAGAAEHYWLTASEAYEAAVAESKEGVS